MAEDGFGAVGKERGGWAGGGRSGDDFLEPQQRDRGQQRFGAILARMPRALPFGLVLARTAACFKIDDGRPWAPVLAGFDPDDFDLAAERVGGVAEGAPRRRQGGLQARLSRERQLIGKRARSGNGKGGVFKGWDQLG